MLSPNDQLRGFLARLLLSPACWAFGAVVAGRNALYDAGIPRTHRVPAPVICVGNLTVGGTGKTPMVIDLAERVRRRGLRAGIVARGYRRPPGEDLNDEGHVIRDALPDVPQVQHPDRVQAAQRVVEEHGAQVVLMDDGFSHRRLHRDLDLVLVDATDPLGGGALLPLGRLREHPRSLSRAGGVIITRADQVPESEIPALESLICRLAPEKPVMHACLRPRDVRCLATGQTFAPDVLDGRDVVALCAIGNPRSFHDALQSLGARILDRRSLRDHAAYAAEIVDDAAYRASRMGDDAAVVCTSKDAVKIRRLSGFSPRPGRFLELRVGVHFLKGELRLEALLDAALHRVSDTDTTP